MKQHPIFSWIFLIPFILLLTIFKTHFGLAICLEDQRSLLLQLKEKLEFESSESSKLVTWNSTLDCCQWVGVQCNDSTGSGYVIGIDLSGEWITGSSDNLSSLFRFQFMQNLSLANNSFGNEEIPSDIGKLSALTHLNLSNTGFGGQVPLAISRLVNLEVLDLSTLYFLGFSTLKLENSSFRKLIQNLTNIRELYLDGVAISAKGSEWCKDVSSSLPKLQVLSLCNCSLSGEINPSLTKLHSLSVIRLHQNNLSAHVPDFLAKFRNLTLLNLSDCKLMGTFPQKILQLPTLRSLDLSSNAFLRGTLPNFPENGSLQTLILSFTNFSGVIPESIGYLKQLRRIELTNCNFSGSMPPSMASNLIEFIDLSVNTLSGPIPSFSLAKNLEHLSLSNNMLTGTLESTAWERLSNLVNLDLRNNSLNGTIPTTLFNLSLLQTMQLSENEFHGEFREFSNTLSILNTLDLAYNKLQGSVPKSLFGLKGLKILKLSSNNFTGSLNLNMFRQFQNLSDLQISCNRLSVDTNDITTMSSFPQLSTLKLVSCNLGVFPEFLKNQSMLSVLDLSGNHIEGTVPKWLWTVSNQYLSYLNLSHNNLADIEKPMPRTPYLNILDLSFNRLQGETPVSFAPILIYLDYSNNNFSSISPGIGTFSYIEYLSLSTNNLTGHIPTSLCNANLFIQVLDLSHNFLNGKIPGCIINMTRTLKVLNLRENQLTDIIHDIFPKDCKASTIDFGKNNIQGLLPKSLANCKLLEVLDLGENQLQDMFPCWLRNMSNLQVLVLRYNRFYGSIDCPPSNMTWPVLQIVDLAFNSFTGKLKVEFFKGLTALMKDGNNLQSKATQIRKFILRLTGIYYQNMLVVTIKGTEIKLQKILTLFRDIDLSSNKFEGDIPEGIGNLVALIGLNLSHNALSGSIPSSISNISELESLDLSNNNLSGGIPRQFAGLTFLSYLNLSCNQLTGKIPTANQFQTFDNRSYLGNIGLCGVPLLQLCPDHSAPSMTPTIRVRKSTSASEFDWQFILLGTGLGTGAGLVTAPFMFWKKGRKWFDKKCNKLALIILILLGFHASLNEASPGQEEVVGHQLFEISDVDENAMEDEHDRVRFCVFCSKLDIEYKRVKHNPKCTCHGSPSISSSASSSF